MYGGLARETGQVHRPHLANRNITPEELEGLEAVLKLTERVADQVRLKYVTALLNNIRTLKSKATYKCLITFYTAVNHYCKEHLKVETSKMDRDSPITIREHVLLNPQKYHTYFLRVPRHDYHTAVHASYL